MPTHLTENDLTNVDDTSDANKPVSSATQTALDLKLNASAISSFGDVADNVQALILSLKKRTLTINGVTVTILTLD